MTAKQFSRFNLNSLLHGYRVNKISDVPDLKLTVVELNHEKTKAKHLHLARDDPNKTFSVQFRTTPKDSAGVAHILEHTVLCGSEKYPVRDPFFKMLTRSLATFMNAFTASDWTMYPFSTLNEKDFKNLLSVYMDAVLKPKLTEYDFMQEGWHLEHTNLKDKSLPLIFKGVVYNEMKGVFSSSENIFSQCVQNQLLPSTYGYVSGGDPHCIPDLTWNQLRQFHRDYYHPSNATFYTYGDMKLEPYLELLDSQYLQHYDFKQVDSSVALEEKWQQSKDVSITCSPDPMNPDKERVNTVAVSFCLEDICNTYQSFLLSLTGRLLIEGDNSPLFLGLLEPGLGTSWAGQCHGYDSSSRTTTFSAGLQGVRQGHLQTVKDKILTILAKVVEEGFPQDRIDSMLHQIELSMKHDDANFGLNLIVGLSYSVNHGASAPELLQISQNVERFKSELKQNPNLLKDIVKKYFLNNPHRLTVVMTPDEKYEAQLAAKEAEKLADVTAKLTEKDCDVLYDKAQQLVSLQSEKPNLDCLPCLHIHDINKTGMPEPFTTETVLDQPVQLNEAPTNGLLYLNMYADLNELSSDLLPYVPLFASIITKVGADGLTYGQMYQHQERYTGGLSCTPQVCSHPANLVEHRQGLHLSSFCLLDNLPRMMDLWCRLFVQPDLKDRSRLATLINMELGESWSSHAISSAGHAFAMRRASATLSPSARITELWSGLEQASHMKQVAQQVETGDMDQVLAAFQRLSEVVLTRQRLRICVNGDTNGHQMGLEGVKRFLSSIRDEKSEPIYGIIPALFRQGHYVMPFSVNYAGQAFRTVPYTSPQYASYRVLGKLLTTKFLHGEIREKGGAYGGGAAARAGHFLFYSYRDPQSSETLKTFQKSLTWVKETQFSDQDLTESKLAVFQEIDRPISAGSRGLSHFLTGVDDEMKQHHRDSLFNVTMNDVIEAANQLRPEESGCVLIGPQSDSQSNQVNNEWKVVAME